jgi:predicted RNase H-like HicB family nuclease
MDSRRYTLWVTVRRADDVPGEWVSHVLDLDVVTQGQSVQHALHMAREAAEMVILHDLNDSKDPLARGETAPEECWSLLWRIQGRGRKLGSVQELDDVLSASKGTGVVQIMVGVERHVPDVDESQVAWFDREPERSSQIECL